jgi:hypothetical protein
MPFLSVHPLLAELSLACLSVQSASILEPQGYAACPTPISQPHAMVSSYVLRSGSQDLENSAVELMELMARRAGIKRNMAGAFREGVESALQL